MKKIGLTFAGGGGKGAYEIGVWKALKEYGVDKQITAVSGTSVGGLNGALFANGDIEQGLKVWESMSPDKILQINPQKIISAIGMLHPSTRVLTALSSQLGFLKSEGIFGQKGLESIIRESLKDGDLKDKIPLYICATDVSDKLSWKPLYKKLNELEYEKIVQYLLATSAIPVAFPTTIVDDKELLDGFLTDNTPIMPLIEDEGCESIIIVLLGRSESITKEKLNYPNVDFWEITPSGDTKEGLGSLDFKSNTATNLIDMGYRDTLKILQNLYEFLLIEQEYIKKGETLRVQDDGFKKLISQNSLLYKEHKQLSLEYKDISSLQYLLSHQKKSVALVSSSTKELQTEAQVEYELSINDKELIDTNLDLLLEEMGSNSKELSQFAFESVTSLATTNGKIDYQINQGKFSRFWGSITGTDHKLQADINLNFSKSIYANTQMIKKLAQRNNLTLDLCIALGNKVNYLAQNQNNLQLQSNQQLQMIGGLKNAIFTLADVTRDALEQHSSRLDRVEYVQKLQNWSHSLNNYINGLNSYDAIMKIVSSYYAVVKNSNTDDGDFFYSALLNTKLDKLTINPSAFIEYVIDNKKKNLTLFEDVDSTEFFPIAKSYEAHIPLFSSIGRVYDSDKKVSFSTIISHLEDNYNINLDADMSGIEFAFELLNGFKIGAEIKTSLKRSKEIMITNLDDISNLLKDDGLELFDREITTLKKKIDDFKVVVPLIGKFSSGKSRLLNSYIIQDTELLKVDTNPTTAVAGEIRYGEVNRVELHQKDSSIKELTLQEMSEISTQDTLYAKYYLNYPKLKHREDLVIVDMPGFESSNLNHNDAINRYFSRGNHYILALSCESTNDSSILKHIKEILSYGAEFSVVITKSDKKLPEDVEKIVKVLRQNIDKIYKNQNYFVGITSANTGEISDLDSIIDSIYEDAPKIFLRLFKKEFDIIQRDVIKHYKALVNVPNDILEFEKQILVDSKKFDEDVTTLHSKLDGIKFSIVSDGEMSIRTKIQSVLDANVSSLVASVKNNSLSMSITELLRPSLNAIFKKLTQDSLKSIEDDSLSISHDLNISFSAVHIDTNLSFFQAIKNFFFDTQDTEIREKLKGSVIPTVVDDVGKNMKEELESLYESIKQLVDEKIEISREKSKELNQEIKEQMKLKTDEHEKLKKKYQESLTYLQRSENGTKR